MLNMPKVIEELAEWIDHTFERYTAAEGEHRNGNGTKRPAVPVLIAQSTSETETDDTGITFVARRHAEQSDDGSDTKTVVMQMPEKGSTATISESELMRRRRLISL